MVYVVDGTSVFKLCEHNVLVDLSQLSLCLFGFLPFAGECTLEELGGRMGEGRDLLASDIHVSYHI